MRLLKSFGFAFQGLYNLVMKEKNFQIHLLALIVICSFAFYFDFSTQEWINILLISAVVMGLEALNTALEKLSDHVAPEIHPSVKKVKDIAAAAVLIAAIFALILAVLMIIPKL